MHIVRNNMRTFEFTWAASGTRQENAEFVTYFGSRVPRKYGEKTEREHIISHRVSIVHDRANVAAATAATTTIVAVDVVVVFVYWKLRVLRARTRTTYIPKWSVRQQ